MKAILTYHSLDDSGSPISVEPAAFRAHARWLAAGHVRVLSVDELLAAPAGEDAVALTFDDAFANFASEAAPALLEHALPCTVFVVSGHAGGTNAWRGVDEPGIPTLPLLDWDALGRLAEAGVELGAHTHTHPPLAALDAASAEREIARSVDEIERRTGRRPRGFAYPYGSVGPDADAAVTRLGLWGVTTDLRALGARESLSTLPRVDMYYFRSQAGLEGWGTARFRYYLRARAGARHVRHALAAARRRR